MNWASEEQSFTVERIELHFPPPPQSIYSQPAFCPTLLTYEGNPHLTPPTLVCGGRTAADTASSAPLPHGRKSRHQPHTQVEERELISDLFLCALTYLEDDSYLNGTAVRFQNILWYVSIHNITWIYCSKTLLGTSWVLCSQVNIKCIPAQRSLK